MQNNILLKILLVFGLLAPCSIALSAPSTGSSEMKTSDIERPRGQLLYETHCSACHEQSVHSRNPRKAESVDKIKYFVTRWSTELKLNWSSSDIDEVAKYLNSKYYNFEQ